MEGEAFMGMMIPITGIVGGLLLGYAGMLQRQRRREMLHNERMRAMELGLELPPQPEEEEGGDPYGNLKVGIVCMFMGVAFVLMAGATQEKGVLIPAFLLGSLGLAFLIIHYTIPKAAERKLKELEKTRQTTSGLISAPSSISRPTPPPAPPTGSTPPPAG